MFITLPAVKNISLYFGSESPIIYGALFWFGPAGIPAGRTNDSPQIRVGKRWCIPHIPALQNLESFLLIKSFNPIPRQFDTGSIAAKEIIVAMFRHSLERLYHPAGWIC
jgi:hypothetical protein